MPTSPSLESLIRRSRLVSGLVMFAYVLCHFVNHATGLISLAAMNRMLHFNEGFWRGMVGRPLLYTALLVHFSLALTALYRRRSLRMSPAEAAQLALGFSLPFLAAQHLVNTRMGNWLMNADLDFSWEVYSYWVVSPGGGVVQEMLLLAVWMHACIGLHFWLKLKPWFERVRLGLFAFALLLPVLAMLGFAEAGREVTVLARDPAWITQVRATVRAPTPAEQAQLYTLRDAIWQGATALVAATLIARRLRWQLDLRRGTVRLEYPNGRKVQVPLSTSVLEASRIAGIPHASICGGRGRCSTCRVRVLGEPACLPPATEHEMAVLQRVGAPPNVRLACQLRPSGTIVVTPLLPPTASARDGFARAAGNQGSEREIAILFADLRGFTKLSEHKLPYDVVFMLNRYFAEMGRAVEQAGGRVDKFIGDGVMALFGLDCGVDTACRQALAAASAMSAQLCKLNEALAADLREPLRIGIGVHAGTAIVGEMGYGKAVSMTAIGDAVNTASRLESHCKEFACELIVSQAVVEHAKADLGRFAQHEIEIRGRDTAMAVYAVPVAGELTQAGVAA